MRRCCIPFILYSHILVQDPWERDRWVLITLIQHHRFIYLLPIHIKSWQTEDIIRNEHNSTTIGPISFLLFHQVGRWTPEYCPDFYFDLEAVKTKKNRKKSAISAAIYRGLCRRAHLRSRRSHLRRRTYGRQPVRKIRKLFHLKLHPVLKRRWKQRLI